MRGGTRGSAPRSRPHRWLVCGPHGPAPCPCAHGRQYPRGRLSSHLEPSTATFIYVSFVTNEAQPCVHIFLGYLNFFFSKNAYCALSALSPGGVILLFTYKSSLHVKNINPFWQTPHGSSEASDLANVSRCLSGAV